MAALSPVLVPELVPETETAPAPMVKTEVLATFPVRVTVPVLTVKAVVRVALVTLPAVKLVAVPVALVKTAAVGMPRSGVTKTGEVARAKTVPVPVVVISPRTPALS